MSALHPLPVPRRATVPRVYASLRILPPDLWPAMVRRRGHRTLLVIDPRATRLEVWLTTNTILTVEEGRAFADAYAAVVQPSELDALVCLYVPPSIRLHNEQAIQGGPELLRRYEHGLMDEELALMTDEMTEERAG